MKKMKGFRKLLALVLALMMVFSAVSALADDDDPEVGSDDSEVGSDAPAVQEDAPAEEETMETEDPLRQRYIYLYSDCSDEEFRTHEGDLELRISEPNWDPIGLMIYELKLPTLKKPSEL